MAELQVSLQVDHVSVHFADPKSKQTFLDRSTTSSGKVYLKIDAVTVSTNGSFQGNIDIKSIDNEHIHSDLSGEIKGIMSNKEATQVKGNPEVEQLDSDTIKADPEKSPSHIVMVGTDIEEEKESYSQTVSTGIPIDQTSSAQDKITKQASTSPATSDAEFKRKQHTVYCVLHGMKSSVGIFYETIQECESCYDETFANGINQLLNKQDDEHQLPSNRSTYFELIEDHLKSRKCPSFCSRLWKYCTAENICNVFQYADEGLLIHSKLRNEEVGTVCKDYVAIKENFTQLGKGGFGEIYEYEHPDSGKLLAIKVEKKRPLVKIKAELFQKITNLKHKNLVEILEYLTGPVSEDGKQLCYLVMPLINQKDLRKQFDENNTCILDYMKNNGEHKQKLIFRNYLTLYCQVFEGLRYLQTQKIVHRDIKSSNILVQQECSCQNAVLCICPDTSKIVYVLGDLDLLCFEERSSTMKPEDWRMTEHDPAGTVEMKPPEAFYHTDKGELVIDHRSDIWSGSVTMMHVLVGKIQKSESYYQIVNYLKLTTSTKTVCNCINSCHSALNYLLVKYKIVWEKARTFNLIDVSYNNEISAMFHDLDSLRKSLNESNTILKKMESFQGGAPEVFKEKSPLAGILSTVYTANNLHWVCLSKLPKIYDTTLWRCMEKTLERIAEGVRLFPGNRPDAGKVVDILKQLQTTVMSS